MSKKNLIIIGAILILAAVAGGFWYASQQTRTNTDLTQTNAEQTRNDAENNIANQSANTEKTKQENQIAGNQEKIDTSNWNEYCNKEYGFCVKYPKGWKVEEEKKRINPHTKEIINKYFSLFISDKNNQNINVNRRIDIMAIKLPLDVVSLDQLIKKSDYLHEYIIDGILNNGRYEKINNQKMFVIKNTDYLLALTMNKNNHYWYIIEMMDPTGLKKLDKTSYKTFLDVLHTFRLLN